MATIVAKLLHLFRAAPPRPPAARVLPAYAALAHRRAPHDLERQLELLVAQLAAERSRCRWCIERGRHLWRDARLPAAALHQLLQYETSGHFSSRERAALRLADAVTRYSDTHREVAGPELAFARQHLSEPEIAAVTAVVAGTHFYDPTTGGLGADAEPRHTAWGAPVGSSLRNLWL